MAQPSRIIRPAYDGQALQLTANVATTPTIEAWGRSRTWIYSASSITVSVFGSLTANGPYVLPTVDAPLQTINGLVSLPDAYWGIPYLRIVASTGTPQIQLGGMG